jgi:beta-galactosidase
MYYFYQSQRDPHLRSDNYDNGPVIYIANYWTAKSPRNLVIFSNADEVEIRINGKAIRRQKPDHGEDVPFGDGSGFDQAYWMKNAAQPQYERQQEIKSPVYNGGNCKALPHPPFTFQDIAFEPGELKAIAYLKGVPIAETVRKTPGAPVSIAVTVSLEGKALAANGGDLVFVHAAILDASGTVVHDASTPVTFAMEGPATLIGDNPAIAEAGISSILLRSTLQASSIKIRAHGAGLREGDATIRSIRQARTELR